MNTADQSTVILSTMGMEFQSKTNIQLISTTTTQTMIMCSASCNQLLSCRTFDYDFVSKRCRLFEGDTTTGSIISSSSSTSLVGTVRISSILYSSTHNQSCATCKESRYEICATDTNICQCPSHTYWDGSICALQLFENDICNSMDACRSDLNLTCGINCYIGVAKCLPSHEVYTAFSLTRGFGQTVVGTCNGSSTTNQTVLSAQADITIIYNNTIYVGDDSNQLFAFDANNPAGRVLQSFSSWPSFLFYDNRTALLYITVMYIHLAYIWPTNKTIPPSGIPCAICSMSCLYLPTGIVVDSVGNVYISSYYCGWVTKWTPNATNGTVVVGSTSGSSGSDSLSLNAPYNLALDEANSFLYVADRFNHRIQRFVLGGSGVGVTVAGGNGQGSAANQLSRPTDIYVSRFDNSIYIADSFNNRIQKWRINDTVGTTVAGSADGTAGYTSYLMDLTYGLAVDYEENYLYVSDSNNNRIQRFALH